MKHPASRRPSPKLILCTALALLVLFAAVFAPLLTPQDPNAQNMDEAHPYYQALEGAGKLAINTAGGALSGKHLNNQTAAGGAGGAGDPDPDTLLGKGADLLSGFLEQSGTDLATEFANMIIYQRGYQANTRIVTVTDAMLEELVNMKR